MNKIETTNELSDTTQEAFSSVMNILDDENMIASMSFPALNTSDSTNSYNNKQWKQWTRDQLNHLDGCSFPTIVIQEDRKFLYDEKHSYMWYKNINLPTITVSVQSDQFQSGRYSVVIDCFGVQFPEDSQIIQQDHTSKESNSRPSFTGDYKRFSLEGEGLQQNILSQKQKIVFQRIKFKETSYNNKGLRFYIVVYIYEVETNQPIFIQLSPSLYIESRKKSFQETQTQLGFSHPFPPETLTKAYAKCSQIINQETIESFSEYYGSCSIRHKIVHPIFLFLKFSRGLKLFYNKNLIDDQLDKKERYTSLFFEIQTQIYQQIQKEHAQKNSSTNNYYENDKNYQQSSSTFSTPPLLALVVNYQSFTPNDKKSQKKIYQKVHRFAKPLIGGVLQVYFEVKDIPHCMKEIVYNERMKDDYKSVFVQLTELKVKMSQQLGPSNTQYSSNPNQQQNQYSSENNQNDDDDSSSPSSNSDRDAKQKPKKYHRIEQGDNRNIDNYDEEEDSQQQDKKFSYNNKKYEYAKNITRYDKIDDSLLKKRNTHSSFTHLYKSSSQTDKEKNEKLEYQETEPQHNSQFMQKKKHKHQRSEDFNNEVQQNQYKNSNESIIFVSKSNNKSTLDNINNISHLSQSEDSDNPQKQQSSQEKFQIKINRPSSSNQTNPKMVTLAKIPEAPSFASKETLATNPTQLTTSFPEYPSSLSAIYPDQHILSPIPQQQQQQIQIHHNQIQQHGYPHPIQSQPQMSYIHYQMPQQVGMQYIQQPMFIPVNQFMPAASPAPQPPMNNPPQGMQVIMNPYQYPQNIYYHPYPTYQIPNIAGQPQMIAATLAQPQGQTATQANQATQFIQPQYINYQHSNLAIPIQNVQQFQQSKQQDPSQFEKQEQSQKSKSS